MFQIFDAQSQSFLISYFDAIKEQYETIVPQAVYGSDKAKIHVAENAIAIDFVMSLHEPVTRYEFTLPHIHAFGNGKHPTTYMCLALLAETLHTRITKNREEISMLDVGTGTGILAIAAAVMGVKHIDACDASIQAYECARKNIDNRFPINVLCCDIQSFESNRQYDCITANLMTALIIASAHTFSSLLGSNGYCIVSGITSERQQEVIETFKQYNCILKDGQTSQGWFAGVFQKL